MEYKATVEIKFDNNPSVYLCTYFDSSDILKSVQNAISKGVGWDNPARLARIIFCNMIRGEYLSDEAALESTTGFGIQTYPQSETATEIRINFKYNDVEIVNNRTGKSRIIFI